MSVKLIILVLVTSPRTGIIISHKAAGLHNGQSPATANRTKAPHEASRGVDRSLLRAQHQPEILQAGSGSPLLRNSGRGSSRLLVHDDRCYFGITIAILGIILAIILACSDNDTSQYPRSQNAYRRLTGRRLFVQNEMLKLIRDTHVTRRLTLDRLKSTIRRHGKDRAYRIIRNEYRLLGLESYPRKLFEADFNRLGRIVPRYQTAFLEKYATGGDWKGLISAKVAAYLRRYHSIDISRHPAVLDRALQHVKTNMSAYLSYMLYGHK